MAKARGLFSPFLYLGSALTLAAAICLAAWIAKPDMSSRPAPPSPDDLREVEADRNLALDPTNPPRVQVEVDYTQGPRAAWFPRGEPPILADSVRSGALPPVAERVGPEPLVLKGCDGIGRQGGTWVVAGGDPVGLSTRLSATTLIRWSPQGFPLVPHVARGWTNSADYRTFTFRLRKGMRWSDGHPFTADDILYWWENEATDTQVMGAPPLYMFTRGKLGRVEKVDDLTVRFSFPEPHGLFLYHIATYYGAQVIGSPAHYLKPYHPRIGDTDLIERNRQSRRLGGKRDVYLLIKDAANPEHPRLWPWLYRKYQPNPPFSFVRNPWYWAVDPEGNQLPYVDRVLCEEVSKEMGSAAIAGGRFTVTVNKPLDYTLLLMGRERGDYRVYRWLRADSCDAMIHCNLNRRVDPDKPDSRWKHEYLNRKEFRRALSLAMDRQAIIDTFYSGETIPAQCVPQAGSFFFSEEAQKRDARHDPAEANRLLDSIGLEKRDYEGYRVFPDGSRMTFFLNHMPWINSGIAQFITDDWNRVGVRTIPRSRDGRLFYTEKAAFMHDFTMWTGENELVPVIEPRVFIPNGPEANFAMGFANWYVNGGLYDNPRSRQPGCIPVPRDHPLHDALTTYETLRNTGDPQEQRRHFNRIMDIAGENRWTIGVCTSPKYVVTVKNGFINVPRLAASTFTFISPGNAAQETYSFVSPVHPPGVAENIQREIATITPAPESLAGVEKARSEESLLGKWVRRAFAAIGVLLVILVAARHPYIGRRLLIMVPTLFVISIVVFTMIQLPPGDYLTSRIMELQMKGDQVDQQDLENIKAMYHLDDPMPLQYLRWVGIPWFKGIVPRREDGRWVWWKFDKKDEGLLQGNLGRSMANNREVGQIVGDRIMLTFVLSLASILITWVVALPVGIYSAVRQYSISDYVLTLLGFVGMCIPSFLLAVVLMSVSDAVFGFKIDGLFSPQYAMQPFWDWPKVADLLKHLWLPVVVLGIGSTGGMIRVMRGNLLDELKKPYVVTARAKGVRPMKLLMKYPVRLALNPFISGIGGIFPALISGGTLISIVLSLPTVGPLMLTALLNEDTMLAGSMLMVLSVLGVLGVLVSDLLLLWLDPRIRFDQGAR